MKTARATRKITPHPRVVSPMPPFSTVDEAVAEIAAGRMVIVVDDEDRENEGDLTMAAQACTPETVAFIRKYASGVICVPMTSERLEQLELPQMVQRNEARRGTRASTPSRRTNGLASRPITASTASASRY